jgi:hypothetical protein
MSASDVKDVSSGSPTRKICSSGSVVQAFIGVARATLERAETMMVKRKAVVKRVMVSARELGWCECWETFDKYESPYIVLF